MSDRGYLLSGFADEIDTDLDVQISVLKECDMSYLVLRSAYGKNISEYTLEEAQEIKDKLDENGIKVSSIGSPAGKMEITDDFEEHYQLYKHIVALANLFETNYIRIFSFFMPEGQEHGNYKDEVIKRLGRMISYAKDMNVVLLHENEKAIYGDTVKHCKDLMETLYCDNFKQAFDFANFVQCDEDPLEGYHELKPYIGYVHIKDARKDDHVIVSAGAGDGHIAEIIDLLKQDNYKGFYSLEPHLIEFDGLQSLEREGDKTTIESDIQDGRTAFITAYNAFIKIMEG